MSLRGADHVAVYLIRRLPGVVQGDGPAGGALVDRSADLDGWDVVQGLSATAKG